MRTFEIASSLLAPPQAVWRHATTPDGINREFRPLLRMTFPAGIDDIAETWRPGAHLFRSWILLFGIVPVEYDDIAIAELEPGKRFLERSTLLSQKFWEHEREIETEADGCRLTDRLRFAPRIPGSGVVYEGVFLAVFRLRHANLRRIFGGESAPVRLRRR